MQVWSELLEWWQKQCDGEWEREFGLTVQSMADPGWIVKVDLAYTNYNLTKFKPVSTKSSDADWMECKIEQAGVWSPDAEFCHFVGMGGSNNLENIIRYFLDHA